MWFFKVKQLKENPITWENLKDLNLFSEEQLWAESQHIFLKDFLEYSCLGTVVKNSPAHAGDARDMGLIPGSGRSLGGGQPNPVFLPEKSHRQRSLEGYSPNGHKQLDTMSV